MEYARAKTFLSELALAVAVPQERFFFAPGNHDVDRSKERLAYSGARSVLTSQAEIDSLLGNSEDLKPLLNRQAAFWDFVQTFTGDQERSRTEDGLAYVANLVVGGVRLAVLCLNSAWMSGEYAEEMRLIIGERQVINALELAEAFAPQLRIAIAHHPINWLAEWDQVSCNNRLLPAVHFFERGHLHMGEVALSSSPEKPCLSIAAGSSHSTRFYANSYNIVDLDLAGGKCTVRPLSYDTTAGTYSPKPEVSAPILLGGSLPRGRDDLAAALAVSVPTAEPYAAYLSDLLIGAKAEIPIRVGNDVEFRSVGVADAIGAEGVGAATQFLGLRNLLRLYEPDVPLATRVEEHARNVSAFVAYLSDLADRDSQCADRLAGPQGRTHRVEAEHDNVRRPRTKGFLVDLRNRADWTLLETQAARFIYSEDSDLAHLARALLAEALMHSDEVEKRREAARQAGELVSSPNASPADYLRAAGSHEVIYDDASAVTLAKQALAMWPGNPDVRAYARSLATRVGDAELRATIDQIVEGQRMS
jgi:hypothetical protein